MGKVEHGGPDPTLSVGQDGYGLHQMQLKQLRTIIFQLKESRNTSEAMLKNLRSELAVLRKGQHNQQEESVSEQRAEALSLDLIDAKNEILRLQSENRVQREELRRLADSGYSTTDVEDDRTPLPQDVRAEFRRMKKKINKAVRQCERLRRKRDSLEHELRTSRFREDEAVVFLRRIRSFYYMIWRNNIVRGSGGYVANRITVVPTDIAQRPAGAADMKAMVELDKLMLEAGLLERDEVGKDTQDDKRPYRPSRAAFQKSNVAAEIAYRNALAAATKAVSTAAPTASKRIGGGPGVHVSNAPRGPISAVRRGESPKVTDARQKLDVTPAGRFIVLREKMLELEITQLNERMVELQEELETERTKTRAPGSDTQLAEECKVLRKQLDIKESDLRVIVSKLREASVLNWKISDSFKKQEEHILYLENRLYNPHGVSIPTSISTPHSRTSKATPRVANVSPHSRTSKIAPTVAGTETQLSSNLKNQGEQKKPPRGGSVGTHNSRQSKKSVASHVTFSDQVLEHDEANQHRLAAMAEEIASLHSSKDGSGSKETRRSTGQQGPVGTEDYLEVGDEEQEESDDEQAHVPEYVLRRKQILEEKRREVEDCSDDSDDDSSELSSSLRSANRKPSRETRFVQPSPQEEWKRKKEAQKKRQKRSFRGTRNAGTNGNDGQGPPAWMQQLKPKAAMKEPPWNKFRKNKGASKPKAEEEDSDVPEFFRKAKKIGVRMANETVVTVDGASSQQTDFAARYRASKEGNSHNGGPIDLGEPERVAPPVAAPSPPPFAAPAPPPPPPPASEPTPPVARSQPDEDERKSRELQEQLAREAAQRAQRAAEEAKNAEEAAAKKAQEEAAAKQKAEEEAAAKKAAEAPKKSSFLDSDSDDSDSSVKKASAPAHSPAAYVPAQAKKKSMFDSDSDDSDDDAPAPKKAPAPAPAKKSFLDSDSDDSDSS